MPNSLLFMKLPLLQYCIKKMYYCHTVTCLFVFIGKKDKHTSMFCILSIAYHGGNIIPLPLVLREGEAISAISTRVFCNDLSSYKNESGSN